MDLLESVYFHNTIRAYLIALAAALGFVLAVRIAVAIVVKRIGRLAARTETSLDDNIIAVVKATRFIPVLVMAIWVGVMFLELPPHLAGYARTAAIIAFLFQAGVWAGAAIVGTVTRLRSKKTAAGDTAGIGILTMVGFFGRVLVWVIVLLLVLDNVGVDITALVAGLGIGGIAVALALQNVLQDLFASVSILLDRPFEIGDSINVDGMIGTVLHVGIKTTRVQSVDGEELVFANGDLLRSRIRNYKRMQERRVLFLIGVTYETPLEQLEALPALFREIVAGEENARFDRAHFKGFGDSALTFEVVYFVKTPAYLTFMDTQQRVNLEIVRRLGALGVSMAYPTQTLYLRGSAASP